MRPKRLPEGKKVISIDVPASVECSRSIQMELQQYVSSSTLSVAEIVDEALRDWLDCVAPARRPTSNTLSKVAVSRIEDLIMRQSRR